MTPSHYINKTITPNEEVLLVARVHPAIYLAMVPYFLIFQSSAYIINFVFELGQNQPMLKLLFVAPVMLFLQAWITITTTELVLTDKRVLAKTGLVSQHSVEINLPMIESIEVKQGLFGQIFNYGVITIRGTGLGGARVPGIASPFEFRRAVQTMINQKYEEPEQAAPSNP